MHVSPVTLSVYAMATRFELVLHGDDATRLRAAGEEALQEIERLDSELSFYRPESQLSRINTHAARESIKVEPRLLRLLRRCADLTTRTDGAFDVTIAPLMRAWGFLNGGGKTPSPSELEAARAAVGMQHVHLDDRHFTVSFDRQGVEIDLGAVGKGYAIERAVGILREAGVTSALLHGGTSAVCTIGAPPGMKAWRVAVRHPSKENGQLEVVNLNNNSLSVSAVHGKSFTDGVKEFGHVIDPRTGQSVEGIVMAAVTGDSATECDALSTALLVLGESGLPILEDRFPDYSGLVAITTSSSTRVCPTRNIGSEAQNVR